MAKILLVEDNRSISGIISICLKKQKHFICCADNGDTVVCKIKCCNFNVIILDLQIPGKDGWKILKELTDEERKKVIVVSANIDREALDLKARAYFDKPFIIKDFLKVVEEIINDV